MLEAALVLMPGSSSDSDEESSSSESAPPEAKRPKKDADVSEEGPESFSDSSGSEAREKAEK